MENASKALLIAGAILIVIILISVAMLIVNQASGVSDTATDLTASQTVQAFNQQFQSYLGSQKGSSIKTLLSQIATNNVNNSGSHTIAVTASGLNLSGSTDSNAISTAISSVSNSKKYKVTQTGIDSEGYITGITIE